jgi:DNA-binding NtrC family response regulator
MLIMTDMASQPNVSSPSRLLVIQGPDIGRTFELGEITRLGRDAENEIVLHDPNVSRVHAEIVKERFSFKIRDCGSRNGILINGIRVKEKTLLKNDEIQIGATRLLFNPDLRIEHAWCSDSRAIYYTSEDVTQEMVPGEPEEVLGEVEKSLVEMLAKLGDIFALAPATTENLARSLVTHLMELFSADRAALLLRERVTGKLRTVLCLPEHSATYLNKQAVSVAYEEKRPYLSYERPEHLRRIPLSGQSEAGSSTPPEFEQGLTIMSTPILAGSAALGVMVVEKIGEAGYSLKDLALFSALGKMTSVLVKSAQLVDFLETRLPDDTGLDVVPSRNSKVRAIFEQAVRVASSDACVIITGESGTGKEVLARAIHEASPRRNGPFVALNCSAIPANLFESELFGYERGAFTGATQTTRGKIEAAHGGTLFLDEIGNLDLSLQPKLLHFLQSHTFYRVGGSQLREADVRIIAATNVDLEEAVREKRFREDLWYRLNVIQFHLPPLRERKEDIGPLADYFIRKAARRSGKEIIGLDSSALILLERYTWPGNIRELANAIERAVILTTEQILTDKDFSFLVHQNFDFDKKRKSESSTRMAPLAEVEKEHILRVLEYFNWNQGKAAEVLGVHRNTLRNKINEYQLRPRSSHG